MIISISIYFYDLFLDSRKNKTQDTVEYYILVKQPFI